MKKLLALVLAACLLMTVVPAFATVADTVAASENLTHDELVEKAKAEEGTFIVYGNTSRISTAAENFSKLYDIPFESNNLKDAEIYTKLESEIKGSAKGADMVMIQDGAQLTYAIEDGWVVNYVPASVKDTVGESDRNPLVHQYINKLFIYNKLGENVPAIKNVWELTAPEMKGNIIFKNPENETVNMNFLVMLTSDENAAKMADAYKAYYGTDIVLDSDCPNAGYQWIKMMYQNGAVLGDSDGDIAKAIGNPEQESDTKWSALITLNKYIKNRKDSTKNPGNYTLDYVKEMDPVAGFIYPIYGLITKNADNPELAKAFLVWLFTEEGWVGDGTTTQRDGSVYKGMSGRMGDYSGNQSLAVTEGDLPVTEWKKILIQEDPIYAAAHRADVEDFIKLIK